MGAVETPTIPFVNQLLKGLLENAWCAGETIVVRKPQRVGNMSKLIAVGGRILPTRVGVQDTAVVPYRRRAYARLTISRPYELVGLRSSTDMDRYWAVPCQRSTRPGALPHGGLHQAMSGRRRALRGAAARTEPADGDEILRQVSAYRHGGVH